MKRDIKNITSILRSELPKLKEYYKVSHLEVFGSFVHNEQTSDSDLDILVSFMKAPSLFKFLELEEYLSKLVGVKVDLVMKNSLKPYIGRRILSEAQPII